MIGPVRHCGKWGYLSKEGAFSIPPKFEALGQCREDRICFLDGGKLGFLNMGGDVVIPPQFEPERFEMPHFKEGLCAIRNGGSVGYIGTNGEWMIAPQFERGWDFLDGRSLAETKAGDAHFCILDRSGNQLSQLDATSISALHDWPESWGCFPVFVSDELRETMLTQWIDWQGGVVFAARYHWMTNWWEGISGFCAHEDRVGYPWGLVRITGEVLAAPRYFALSEFVDGLARAGRTPRQFGFISPGGEWLIEPYYSQAEPFSEGLACVTVKGRKGFINTRGEMVIEARFGGGGRFRHGFAHVEYECKRAVIDKTGRVIWSAELERE